MILKLIKDVPFLHKCTMFIVGLVYKLVSFTWRVKVELHPEFTEYIENSKRPLPFIILWHEMMLPMVAVGKNYPIVPIVSMSKDGALVADYFKKANIEFVRGSSRRGSLTAVRGILKIVKRRSCWIISTIDGPKGPAFQAKEGFDHLAYSCKGELFGAGCTVGFKKRLMKSWDKMVIPLPFSKINVFIGEPVLPNALKGKGATVEFTDMKTYMETAILSATDKSKNS